MCRLELNIQLFAATATITNARQGNYSIDNNNEVQRITFKVKRTSGTTHWDDNKTLTFTLKYYNDNGTQTTLTQTKQFNFPSGSVGAEKSTYIDFTVPHKSDGTQSISYEASIVTGTSVGTLHPTGSATLETIPRASSITVNDANIGSATNIVINKASSGFTTTLWYKATGQSSWSQIVDRTSNQVYGWTVPTSFYSLIPNSKTISCEFYAETYSGDTLIGTSSTTATFTATGNPVINSFTLIDTNSTTIALTGDSSKMIRYASNVRATISASGQNSATISSIKVNGTTASSGIVNFNAASTNSFNVVVTDSRGYTTSQTKTMTMVDYIPLTLNATIKRNTPVDGKINIEFNGNYFNGSFGSQSNTLTIQYRSIEKGGSWENVQWNNLTATLNNNAYSGTGQLSNYDYTKQYEFQIRAVDKVQTKTIEGISIAKGQPIFNWRDGYFNVNGDYYKNGSLLSNSFLSTSGGTISGNLNVTGNLQKSGSNVALASAIPTNNNQLINGRGFITINVLWQNNNDTSDFASQTITLDNNNYNYLIVIYKQDKNTNLMLSMTTPKGSGIRLISNSVPSSSSYAPLLMIRNITYTSDTQLSVANCETKRSNQTSGYSTDNSLLIPYMILGIV